MLPTASGILLLDKPGMGPRSPSTNRGDRNLPTSHDMVRHVRQCLGIKRVGHTGTLDPFASGLLVLCIGKATRLAEYYQGLPKTYVAEIQLGIETTTDDVTGDMIGQVQPISFSHQALEEKLQEFLGPQEQIPPSFSAKKIGGQRAYRMARAGKNVVLKPSIINIYQLDVEQPLQGDRVTIRVSCSAGTYIRSLARDLGHALGVGGCLASLRRLTMGGLHVNQALTPEEVKAHAREHSQFLLLPGEGLPMSRIPCDAPTLSRLGHGQSILHILPTGSGTPGTEALAVDQGGAVWGVVTCEKLPGEHTVQLRARKWLAPV